MQTARSKDIIKKRKGPYSLMANVISVIWSFLSVFAQKTTALKPGVNVDKQCFGEMSPNTLKADRADAKRGERRRVFRHHGCKAAGAPFASYNIAITRANRFGTMLSGRNMVSGFSSGSSLKNRRYSLFFKVIAVALACLLLNDSISWAYGDSYKLPQRGKREYAAEFDINKFEITPNLGSVKNRYRGTSGKTVIHIQDAHCNYSCQNSIKNIISYLNEEYGVDLALLEGGAGSYDLSMFTSIEDKPLREKVADYFVKEGRVNGAEFFAINNPDKITLKGLEDAKLYIENLKAYRESLAHKDDVEKILNILGYYLSNLKRHIYPEGLKEFEQKRMRYNDNEMELKEYLPYLNSISKGLGLDVAKYKNLRKLTQAVEGEKSIDFNLANIERNRLIDRLTKMLSSAEVETLVEKAVQFKKNDIKQTEFYSYLFKKADSTDVDAEETCPNLTRYRSYIELYESIDEWVLFDEIEGLENAIVEKLCDNDTQKKLYALSQNLQLLKDLFNISLTTNQHKHYYGICDSLKIGNFLSFINIEALKYNIRANISDDVKALDLYREEMEKFYRLAFRRDAAFMGNIALHVKTKDNLIVVTGGFHTENVEKLLKEKGYSYITIMPEIEGEKDNNIYFSRLAGKENNPVEDHIRAILDFTIALASPFTRLGRMVREEIDGTDIDEESIVFGLYMKWVSAIQKNKGIAIKCGDRILGAIDAEKNVKIKEDWDGMPEGKRQGFDIVPATQFTTSRWLPAPERFDKKQAMLRNKDFLLGGIGSIDTLTKKNTGPFTHTLSVSFMDTLSRQGRLGRAVAYALNPLAWLYVIWHEAGHAISDLFRGRINIVRNELGAITGAEYVSNREEGFRHPGFVAMAGPLGVIGASYGVMGLIIPCLGACASPIALITTIMLPALSIALELPNLNPFVDESDMSIVLRAVRTWQGGVRLKIQKVRAGVSPSQDADYPESTPSDEELLSPEFIFELKNALALFERSGLRDFNQLRQLADHFHKIDKRDDWRQAVDNIEQAVSSAEDEVFGDALRRVTTVLKLNELFFKKRGVALFAPSCANYTEGASYFNDLVVGRILSRRNQSLAKDGAGIPVLSVEPVQAVGK
ncbi:MAG: hypothetical protein JW994_04820, partial [Candidatus Omnitrophica bacterium]|nr:hypothetical protein [Candidatus Omnitrophota bacterium]